MKLSLTAFAVVLAAVLPGASAENASNKQAEQEPSTNLRRRANIFNNGNGDNSANVGVIVVLHDDGRRRKLSGNGQATAAERKAAAEENKAAAAAAAKSMGAAATLTYGTAIYGFAANVPPGLIKKIEADSRVAYVDLDAVVQLDPMEMEEDRRRLAPPPGKGPGNGGGGGGDDGGGGGGSTQTIPWGITRVNGGTATPNVGKAWVLDTGIDLYHPDLNVDIANSRSFTREKDGNDNNGHGTHVAGTIAAIDNNIGVVGVVPGASVVAVKVLDRRGGGSWSGIIAGVDYTASKCGSKDVANMSLGGGYNSALNAAVTNASENCAFVIAAGNSDADAANFSPASATGSNVYTVSAFGSGDYKASFSNYGLVVDYAGPGVSIESTWKGGGYRSISGTSMAAPHVAGVALDALARGVLIATDGTMNGDKDNEPDPIATC